MAGKRKVFGTRIFGGIKYWFSSDFNTKQEAVSYASRLRKQGKPARVTKQKTLISRSIYYVVWVKR